MSTRNLDNWYELSIEYFLIKSKAKFPVTMKYHSSTHTHTHLFLAEEVVVAFDLLADMFHNEVICPMMHLISSLWHK